MSKYRFDSARRKLFLKLYERTVPSVFRMCRQFFVAIVIGSFGLASFYVQAETATVLSQFPQVRLASGTLRAQADLHVASRSTATLAMLNVQEGEQLKKGDVIARLDDSDLNSKIEAARAQYKTASDALVDAQLDEQKYGRLYESGYVSENNYRKARLLASKRADDVRRAKSQLEQVLSEIQYVQITAPTDGVVTSIHRRVGELVTPGIPIVSFQTHDGVLGLEVEVPQNVFKSLTPGLVVDLKIDGQEQLRQGRLEWVIPVADQRSRTFRARFALDDATGLHAGTYGVAEIPLPEANHPAIPQAALTDLGGLSGVFVVKDGHAHFHWLKVGRERHGLIEVLSGLNGGEEVVLNPAATLKDGDPFS